MVNALAQPWWHTLLRTDDRSHPQCERLPLDQVVARIGKSRHGTLSDCFRIARCTGALANVLVAECVFFVFPVKIDSSL